MLNAELWSEIPQGTIIDTDIVKLAESRQLITEHFCRDGVKQACYELRASDVFWETSASRENKLAPNGEKGYILRPNSYVTAIVQESIELPPNVLARILTKGQLFSIGVLPVCTYADPGFTGRLGITLFNASHRHILIEPGQPLAKIEFSLLNREVQRPYRGQHGYETEMWPIPVRLYAQDDQLKAFGVHTKSLDEIELSYGPAVRSLEARLRFYERRVWLQIALTVLGFLLVFAVIGGIGWFWAVVLGVAGNLITNLGQYLFGLRWRTEQ